MTENAIADPILKQRLAFRRTTGESGAEVLHVETWVDPGGGVPPHVHPDMEERFTVHSGHCDFLGGRHWRTAGPGETVVVPAGVRHAYRNRSDETAHVVCEAEPASTLQEFLEAITALGQAGRLTRHALPNSFAALLEAVVIAEDHKEMVELGFPMPPRPVQKLLFPPLARIGRRRGLAGRMPTRITSPV